MGVGTKTVFYSLGIKVLNRGVKWPGFEANHSAPSNALSVRVSGTVRNTPPPFITELYGVYRVYVTFFENSCLFLRERERESRHNANSVLKSRYLSV